MIGDDAIYWFNDGSFQGKTAIQQAFEKTWSVIQEERYTIEDVYWLVKAEQIAVCVYLFRWQGRVDGQFTQGAGRGTNILKKVADQWQVIHEHLSALPE